MKILYFLLLVLLTNNLCAQTPIADFAQRANYKNADEHMQEALVYESMSSELRGNKNKKGILENILEKYAFTQKIKDHVEKALEFYEKYNHLIEDTKTAKNLYENLNELLSVSYRINALIKNNWDDIPNANDMQVEINDFVTDAFTMYSQFIDQVIKGKLALNDGEKLSFIYQVNENIKSKLVMLKTMEKALNVYNKPEIDFTTIIK